MISERCFGTVTYFHPFGGGGTIQMHDGREVRVRYSAIRGTGVRQLATGCNVSFLLERHRRGLYAVCVQEEMAP